MNYQILFDFISQINYNDIIDYIETADSVRGRQQIGYEKIPVPMNDERFTKLISKSLIAMNVSEEQGFGCWVIKYPIGSCISEGTDPAPFGLEHWRLNAVLQNDSRAMFTIAGRAVNLYERDAVIFRPDICQHSVSTVEDLRLVWSVGVLKSNG